MKNCVWNTDSIRGNVEVGDCSGYNSEWNSGAGTCYQQIDTSYEIPAGQVIALDDIGYKIVYGKNTTDSETALRCYNPSNGNVVSVAGTEGLSYEQVKSMCPSVSDYPKPWTRWGYVGSGMNYGKYLWMDKDFNIIASTTSSP